MEEIGLWSGNSKMDRQLFLINWFYIHNQYLYSEGGMTHSFGILSSRQPPHTAECVQCKQLQQLILL